MNSTDVTDPVVKCVMEAITEADAAKIGAAIAALGVFLFIATGSVLAGAFGLWLAYRAGVHWCAYERWMEAAEAAAWIEVAP